MIDVLATGDPLVLGALIGVGILLVSWMISILASGDVEEGTERLFSVMTGLLLGIASILVIIIGELTTLVAEAPGVVATAVAGTAGWLSLSGIVSIGPSLFAFLVVATLIGAIATRES